MGAKNKHGMTGRRNAAKHDSDKRAAERITLGVPSGTMAALKRHAHPGKVSPKVWGWIVKGAKAEGLDLG